MNIPNEPKLLPELVAKILNHTGTNKPPKLLCASRAVHNAIMTTLPRRARDATSFETFFQRYCRELPARRGWALYNKSGSNALVLKEFLHKVLKDVPVTKIVLTFVITFAISTVFSEMNGQTMVSRAESVSNVLRLFYFLLLHAVTLGMLLLFNKWREPALAFKLMAVAMVVICALKSMANSLY